MRDYGTGLWEGGDPDCDHAVRVDPKVETSTLGGGLSTTGHQREGFKDECPHCGARRVDQQLGLEATPDEYVARMVEVFREVRRVLRADGTCFLNIADSYSGGSDPSPSHQPQRDPACGSDGRGLPDSPDPDFAYLDLCGDCLADFPSHRERIADNDQRNEQAQRPDETTTRGSEPVDSLPGAAGAVPLDAPASMPLESSLLPRVVCWRCGSRPASTSLRVPLTSSLDAATSSDMESYTSGNASPESVFRNQDTDASALALLYSTIAARRLKPKDATLMPQLLALALQLDGWIVRSEIIWAKKNCMPESVTDRPTKSHEQIWLLSKSPRYFWDQEAVREPHMFPDQSRTWPGGTLREATQPGNTLQVRPDHTPSNHPNGRNVRSVWEIATQPYPEAHFATFPEALVERCVKAGTSEYGCCSACGKPWEREVEKVATGRVRERATGGLGTEVRRETHGLASVDGQFQEGVEYRTTGWRPGCGHDAKPAPCVVLDIFLGSGTTAFVARRLGRRSIGIELSPEYCELAARRMQQQSLFAGAG